MEILTVYVTIDGGFTVTGKDTVTLVPFHGYAKSHLFEGSILPGAVDTQRSHEGSFSLSARYILEGTDKDGEPCRIFIQNETGHDGRICPSIVTDSKALAYLQYASLYSEISPSDDGVIVRIYEG
ncbi:MAG: DUF3237 domain-containing protein [Oscillospiraceae bacterium]|nr:DUF3237 domain-containing protein [Oscillospiraceae bacterium]